jgi:hypothetical protein
LNRHSRRKFHEVRQARQASKFLTRCARFSTRYTRLRLNNKGGSSLASPYEAMSAKPPVSRLDPKLTRRGVFAEPSHDTTITTSRSGFSNNSESSFGSGSEYSDGSGFSDGPVLENTNPRLHLLHNGKWIPKKVMSALCLDNGPCVIYPFLVSLVRNRSTSSTNGYLGLLRRVRAFLSVLRVAGGSRPLCRQDPQ